MVSFWGARQSEGNLTQLYFLSSNRPASVIEIELIIIIQLRDTPFELYS